MKDIMLGIETLGIPLGTPIIQLRVEEHGLG